MPSQLYPFSPIRIVVKFLLEFYHHVEFERLRRRTWIWGNCELRFRRSNSVSSSLVSYLQNFNWFSSPTLVAPCGSPLSIRTTNYPANPTLTISSSTRCSCFGANRTCEHLHLRQSPIYFTLSRISSVHTFIHPALFRSFWIFTYTQNGRNTQLFLQTTTKVQPPWLVYLKYCQIYALLNRHTMHGVVLFCWQSPVLGCLSQQCALYAWFSSKSSPLLAWNSLHHRTFCNQRSFTCLFGYAGQFFQK